MCDSCVIPRITHHITLQKRESHFRSVIEVLFSHWEACKAEVWSKSRFVLQITLRCGPGPSEVARCAWQRVKEFVVLGRLAALIHTSLPRKKYFGGFPGVNWRKTVWSNEMRLYSYTHYLTSKLSTLWLMHWLTIYRPRVRIARYISQLWSIASRSEGDGRCHLSRIWTAILQGRLSCHPHAIVVDLAAMLAICLFSSPATSHCLGLVSCCFPYASPDV